MVYLNILYSWAKIEFLFLLFLAVKRVESGRMCGAVSWAKAGKQVGRHMCQTPQTPPQLMCQTPHFETQKITVIVLVVLSGHKIQIFNNAMVEVSEKTSTQTWWCTWPTPLNYPYSLFVVYCLF